MLVDVVRRREDFIGKNGISHYELPLENTSMSLVLSQWKKEFVKVTMHEDNRARAEALADGSRAEKKSSRDLSK